MELLPDRTATMTSTRGHKGVVGDICLYGTRESGYGFIAAAPGQPLMGTGELRYGTRTHAVEAACETLRGHGVRTGEVWVYDCGGERKAATRVDAPLPISMLSWRPAEQYAVNVDDILAGGKEPS
jgi:hypothetical protein